MKFRYIVGTLVPCLALSPIASALVMNFNDGSGSYTSNGITGSASATGGSVFYNGVENAIGVGTNVLNGALAQGETLSVLFNSSIKINNIYFRQWENPGLIITYDQVVFDYFPGGFLTFTNSGQGITLLDQFSTGGITLDSFTLLPQNSRTAIYLHSIDFDLIPVEPTDPTQPTEPTDPTDPTHPTDPTDPTDPTTPTDPTDPTDPTIPTDPTDPTQPTTPVGNVPAPGTLLLLGGAMLGLRATRRKRKA